MPFGRKGRPGQARAWGVKICARQSRKKIREDIGTEAGEPSEVCPDGIPEPVTAPEILSAQERQAWLTEVIRNPDVDVNTKLKASDQLNKMTGEYGQKPEEKEDITIRIGLVDDE